MGPFSDFLRPQELQVLVRQLRQEASSQFRASEHQAERLRIEIVSLRERLDEEMASQSGLQGALEREQEERGGQGERLPLDVGVI